MSEIQLITVRVKKEDDQFVKISFHNFLDDNDINEVVLDTETALDMSNVIKDVVYNS